MLSFSLRWILAVPGWFAARSVALEGRPDDGRGLALRMLAVVPRRPRVLSVPGVSVCACPCSALAGVLLVPPLVNIQLLRVRSAEPEDSEWMSRVVMDCQFLVVALWRLRTAARIAASVDSDSGNGVARALAAFDGQLPDL